MPKKNLTKSGSQLNEKTVEIGIYSTNQKVTAIAFNLYNSYYQNFYSKRVTVNYHRKCRKIQLTKPASLRLPQQAKLSDNDNN